MQGYPNIKNLTPSHSLKNITNWNDRSISTVERLAFSYISFIDNYSINTRTLQTVFIIGTGTESKI